MPSFSATPYFILENLCSSKIKPYGYVYPSTGRLVTVNHVIRAAGGPGITVYLATDDGDKKLQLVPISGSCPTSDGYFDFHYDTSSYLQSNISLSELVDYIANDQFKVYFKKTIPLHNYIEAFDTSTWTKKHVQYEASTTWTFVHGFGYERNFSNENNFTVTCTNFSGTTLYPSLSNIDNNTLLLTFTTAVSGIATATFSGRQPWNKYTNPNKPSLLFGTITISDLNNNVVRVTPYGLKDYALNALPAHNRTTDLSEMFKEYFDRIHNEPYFLTGDLLTLQDPFEVNADYLEYLYKIYYMDIISRMNETRQREYAASLPGLLKRKGSYSSLYDVWNVLTMDTANFISVYERWHDWDIGEDVPLSHFIDYLYTSYLPYATSPTSYGAGPVYYGSIITDPNGSLESFSNTSLVEVNHGQATETILTMCMDNDRYRIEPNVYTIIDANNIKMTFEDASSGKILIVKADETFTQAVASDTWTVTHSQSSTDILVNVFDSNKVRVKPISLVIDSDSQCTITFTEAIAGTAIIKNATSVFTQSTTALTWNIYHTYGSYVIPQFFNTSNENVEPATVKISNNYIEVTFYEAIAGTAKLQQLVAGSDYGSDYNVDGSVLSPHYRVEMDLSSEPLEATTILSEDLSDTLLVEWEKMRPVCKFAHYSIVLSPKTNFSGKYIPLYDYTTTNINTRYCGERITVPTEDCYIHVQTISATTWVVRHGLNSFDVITQCFDSSGFLIEPIEIENTTSNYLTITFGSAFTGNALVLKSDSVFSAVAPSGAWDVIHTVGTQYPIIQIDDSSYGKILPYIVVTTDTGEYTVRFHNAIDDDNISLVHFNGSDKSQTITDETEREWTASGSGVTLDTSKKVFGSASLVCDGTDSYVYTPGTKDFYFNDDFTIEAWCNTTDNTIQEQIICSQENDALNYWRLYIVETKKAPVFEVVADIGVTNFTSLKLECTEDLILNDSWYHVVVVRHKNIWSLYLNGQSVGALSVDGSPVVTNTFDATLPVFTGTVNIGRAISLDKNFTGNIDEFRISQCARYTDEFRVKDTVPFVLTDNNESYMDFENAEDGSTDFIDTSGRTWDVYNNGVEISTTTSAEGSGSAYFNGNGYLYSDAPSASNFQGDFNLQFYFKLETETINIAFYNQSINDEADSIIAYATKSEETGLPDAMGYKFYLKYGDVILVSSLFHSLRLDTWYHVVFESVSGISSFYFNGVSENSFSTPAIPVVSNSNKVTIGSKAQYSQDTNTVLLLHMDGDDGSTTFTDSSASGHTVSVVGDAQIDTSQYKWTASGWFPRADYTVSLLHFENRVWTFNGSAKIDTTQKKFGTGSLYLDGTGYLTTPDSEDWYFGTADFTVDFWVKFSSVPTDGNYAFFMNQRPDANNTNYLVLYNNGGTLQWDFTTYSGGVKKASIVRDTVIYEPFTWLHIALVRSGNNFMWFQDGTQLGTTEVSAEEVPNHAVDMYVGRWAGGDSHYFIGYLDEVRITKGLARWTTNFTPPTEKAEDPEEDSRYISALLHFDGPNGGTNYIDSTGKTTWNNYFLHLDNAQSKFGGTSLFCDGDHYIHSGSASFQFPGDYTIDFWFRYPSGSGSGTFYDSRLFNADPSGLIIYLSAGYVKVGWEANAQIIAATTYAAPDTWHHVVLARSGSSTKLFLNGVQEGSTWEGLVNLTSTRVLLGVNISVSSNFYGWIDELRIVKGKALWTSDFTPPTSVYESANVKSLLHFDEADGSTYTKDSAANWAMDGAAQFYDESGKLWTASADAQLDTSQKKWTASGLFNGISDYITTPASDDFTTSAGDFTIDCWVRFSELDESKYYTTAYQRKIGVGEIEFGYFYYSSGSWQLECYLTDQVSDPQTTKTLKAAVSLSIDIWYHVAFCRSGTDLYLFLSGDLVDSDTWTGTSDFKDSPFYIGAYGGEYDYFKGNIDEFRFSKGIARWTANFTPPTEEYTLGSGTTINPGFLMVNDSTDFAFGTDDFTIEFWARPGIQATSWVGIVSTLNNSDEGWCVGLDAMRISFMSDWTNRTSDGYTLTADVWSHVAIVKGGTTLYMFLNGVKVYELGSYSDTVNASGDGLVIGRAYVLYDYSTNYNGHIDELRITKGIARWTEAFTPPTSPYDTSLIDSIEYGLNGWIDQFILLEDSHHTIDFDPMAAEFDHTIVDANQDGYAINGRFDYEHVQTTPNNIWTVNHMLKSESLMIEVFDEHDNLIKPDSIQIISKNICEITFGSMIGGRAVIKLVGVLGTSMESAYNDISYVKIGIGTTGLYWEPTIQQNLEDPIDVKFVVTKMYDSVYYYFKAVVEYETDDVNITELGLFTSDDKLLFYTYGAPLFKDKKVLLTLFYRVEKTI